uniref:Alkaline phosphatase n=1 Tax=Hadrurus spadix TaxID=141984 RepID=A0A1W7RB25_9SCOR
MFVCTLWRYVVCATVLYPVSTLNNAEFKQSYWQHNAMTSLKEALKMKLNTNVAKNVILFLGDGMGISTITGATIYKGQKAKQSGEEQNLIFQKFPHVALIKTYSVDMQVSDSAATATAFLTGVKTRNEMLGLTADATVGNCNSVINNEVHSIMKWAQDEGKDTGFVTTTRVTHATPAALYAHSPDRDWENDAQLPKNATKCKDIARQLVEDIPGRESKVIFGGGRRHFMTKNMSDVEDQMKGGRQDGRDLIKLWKNDKQQRGFTHRYVTNLEEFLQIDPEKTDFVMGLFAFDHMQYEADRDKTKEPSIAEMTEKAISVLKKNDKGYFLLVEGGRIDHAHHNTMAAKALEDTVAMADAVQKAVEITDQKDTLIIVTADHSHVLTINGYPKRGNSLLGIAGVSDIDKKSYTTLMYTNGPGQEDYNVSRADTKDQNTTSFDYTQQTTVPLKFETHGGEDVALFATGPMAHLFHGVKEQNYIAYAMGYASCVGPNKEHCCHGTCLDSSAAIIHSSLLINIGMAIVLWVSSF